MNNDIRKAKMYNISDITIASLKETTPLTNGRYGFEILSALISVNWFRVLDAPFSIAKAKLAGIIVVNQIKVKSPTIPLLK